MALDSVPPEHRALLHPRLTEDAGHAQVVWARVRGYPSWPAQVLSDAAARKKLGKVPHRRDMDVPVMFFGTLEIAWIGKADIVPFADGIKKGFLGKGKQKNFQKALEQVLEFLSVDKKRKAPTHWWSKAPAHNGTDDVAAKAASRSSSASKHASKKQASSSGDESGSSSESGSGSDDEEQGSGSEEEARSSGSDSDSGSSGSSSGESEDEEPDDAVDEDSDSNADSDSEPKGKASNHIAKGSKAPVGKGGAAGLSKPSAGKGSGKDSDKGAKVAGKASSGQPGSGKGGAGSSGEKDKLVKKGAPGVSDKGRGTDGAGEDGKAAAKASASGRDKDRDSHKDKDKDSVKGKDKDSQKGKEKGGQKDKEQQPARAAAADGKPADSEDSRTARAPAASSTRSERAGGHAPGAKGADKSEEQKPAGKRADIPKPGPKPGGGGGTASRPAKVDTLSGPGPAKPAPGRGDAEVQAPSKQPEGSKKANSSSAAPAEGTTGRAVGAGPTSRLAQASHKDQLPDSPQLPPRRRLKVEEPAPSEAGTRAGTGTVPSTPVVGSPAAVGEASGRPSYMDITPMDEQEILKLPIEIRRLAGIKLAKKPTVGPVPSPREPAGGKDTPSATPSSVEQPAGVSNKAKAAAERLKERERERAVREKEREKEREQIREREKDKDKEKEREKEKAKERQREQREQREKEEKERDAGDAQRTRRPEPKQQKQQHGRGLGKAQGPGQSSTSADAQAKAEEAAASAQLPPKGRVSDSGVPSDSEADAGGTVQGSEGARGDAAAAAPAAVVATAASSPGAAAPEQLPGSDRQESLEPEDLERVSRQGSEQAGPGAGAGPMETDEPAATAVQEEAAAEVDNESQGHERLQAQAEARVSDSSRKGLAGSAAGGRRGEQRAERADGAERSERAEQGQEAGSEQAGPRHTAGDLRPPHRRRKGLAAAQTSGRGGATATAAAEASEDAKAADVADAATRGFADAGSKGAEDAPAQRDLSRTPPGSPNGAGGSGGSSGTAADDAPPGVTAVQPKPEPLSVAVLDEQHPSAAYDEVVPAALESVREQGDDGMDVDADAKDAGVEDGEHGDAGLKASVSGKEQGATGVGMGGDAPRPKLSKEAARAELLERKRIRERERREAERKRLRKAAEAAALAGAGAGRSDMAPGPLRHSDKENDTGGEDGDMPASACSQDGLEDGARPSGPGRMGHRRSRAAPTRDDSGSGGGGGSMTPGGGQGMMAPWGRARPVMPVRAVGTELPSKVPVCGFMELPPAPAPDSQLLKLQQQHSAGPRYARSGTAASGRSAAGSDALSRLLGAADGGLDGMAAGPSGRRIGGYSHSHSHGHHNHHSHHQGSLGLGALRDSQHASVEDLQDAEAAEALMGMCLPQARPSGGSYLEATTSGGLEELQDARQGFVWPRGEPLLPDQQEVFVPPGEWLQVPPPQYEHLKRNLWVSRKRPTRLHKDEISVCYCTAPQLQYDDEGRRIAVGGCVEGCLNRMSLIHCDARSCPCGELCCNKPFHLLKMPKLQTYLTENRGHGIRAQQFISKGAFVVEYSGEVVDAKELELRMQEARRGGEQHFYIMELAPGLFIDARYKGNIARLLNSSCDPNCETQKWHDSATGEARIGIFARRDIRPGEELTYDYFFEHYGPFAPPAASFQCMCGAKNCRGTMDLNPEKRKDLGRRIEVFWDGDGIFYRATVIGFHAASRKHVVLYDDGDKERVHLEDVPHRWLDDEAGLGPVAGSGVPLIVPGSAGAAGAALASQAGTKRPGSALYADGSLGMGDDECDIASMGRMGGSLNSTPRGELGLPLKKRVRTGPPGYPSSAPPLGRDAGADMRGPLSAKPGGGAAAGGTNMDSLLQAVQALEDGPEGDGDGMDEGAGAGPGAGQGLYDGPGQRSQQYGSSSGRYGAIGRAQGEVAGAPPPSHPRFFSGPGRSYSSGGAEGSPHHAPRLQLYTPSGPGSGRGDGGGNGNGGGGSLSNGPGSSRGQGVLSSPAHGRPSSAGGGAAAAWQQGSHSAPPTAMRGGPGGIGAATATGGAGTGQGAAAQGIPRLEDILGIRLAPCSVPLFCSLQSRAAAAAARGGSTGPSGSRTPAAGGTAAGAGPSGSRSQDHQYLANGVGASGSRLANGSNHSEHVHRPTASYAHANGFLSPGAAAAAAAGAAGAGGSVGPSGLHAALAKGLVTPMGGNGVNPASMSLLLNSPVLAAMPASQMSTMSLLTGLRS